MPEPAYLFASLIFSSIGLGYLIYGRRQKHKIAFYCGISLIVFPYIITTLPAMVITGLILMAIPRFYRL